MDFKFKTLETLAGTGIAGSKNGTCLKSQIGYPRAICMTSSGKLIIIDSTTNEIRSIENGMITTIAGGPSGYSEGPALKQLGSDNQARFQKPSGLCLSPNGDIFIADTGNHAIRVLSDGQVSTFCGGNGEGFKEGHNKFAQFSSPESICFTPQYDLLIADTGNHRIRIVSNLSVTTYSGTGEPGYLDGPTLEAKYRGLTGICVTSSGDVLVADSLNHYIRLIHEGIVSTLAGDGTPRFLDGPLRQACFKNPHYLALCPYTGDLAVSDQQNARIRLISNGKVKTIIGSGKEGFKDGKVDKAKLNYPGGLVWSRSGRLIIADGYNSRIRYSDDDNRHLAPDFGNVIELHSRNEALSRRLGDVQIVVNDTTWFLQQCILHQRCPEVLKIEKQKLLSSSVVPKLAQLAFWNFIYRDVLPEGQYGVSFNSIKLWIELHEMAYILSMDRLIAHCCWRVSYLLQLAESKDIFAALCVYVRKSFPSFFDTLINIIASNKSKFSGDYKLLESVLSYLDYDKLVKTAAGIPQLYPQPVNSPIGLLALQMEPLLMGSGKKPQVAHTMTITVGKEVFYCHAGVIIPQWPLAFKWFFTRPEGDESTNWNISDMTVSDVVSKLRFCYTGKEK